MEEQTVQVPVKVSWVPIIAGWITLAGVGTIGYFLGKKSAHNTSQEVEKNS